MRKNYLGFRIVYGLSILLVLQFIFGSRVYSDTVTLVNGSEIFGEVTMEGEQTVKIKTPAGNLEFPRERVVKVIRESPDVTYTKFGKYYLDRKDYNRAVAAFEKALEKNPTNADIQSKLELAKSLSKKIQSSEADTIVAAGDRSVIQEQYLDAIDIYAKITTMNLGDTWNKKAFEKIAHVYILQANRAMEFNKREELVGKALAINPQSAEAHYEQGMIYLQKNQTEPARQQFEQSLTWDPGFVQSHRILGNIYFNDQKYLEASEQYEQVKKLSLNIFSGVKQNLVGCYLALGNQSYQNQKYDEARVWFEKYLELDSRGNWSLLYETQYQLKKLDIDPTKSDDHFNLGLWCQDKNLDNDAMVEFKTAFKLDSSNFKAKRKMVEIYDKFASSLYQTGTQKLNSKEYGLAINSFSRITADYPESSFSAEANRLIGVTREQWAENIYAYAKSSFDARYFDRAFEGFNNIVQNFSDTQRFVDAQRMLARTKSQLRFEENAGNDRKQRLDELQKIIDSSAGEDHQAWNRIKEMQFMAQYDFEARLSNLILREKNLIRGSLDRVVYLFYDSDKGVDKLRPMALKYSLPVADRSKVRTEQDYIKLLQFALLLSISQGDEYYNAWQELIPYFSTGPSELEDAKSRMSDDAKRLIEERGSEVYRILNLKRY